MSEMDGACSSYGGEERCIYRVLEGRPEGRIALGRQRHRWEDNIKIDLLEVGWGHGLHCSGSL
jgi:hypothetical protein